jgi:hypothetical protein
MRPVATIAFVAALSTATAACAAPEQLAALTCPAPSESHWLPDSSAGLCLPAGFEPRGRRGFARARGDTLPEHWLAISVHQQPALEPGEQWPLTLASSADCIADCATVEQLAVRRDSLAGVPAYIETGLVSGGFSGEEQAPALVASLDGRPAWTAVVNVISPSTAIRDSLAAALATLRVWPSRVRDE